MVLTVRSLVLGVMLGVAGVCAAQDAGTRTLADQVRAIAERTGYSPVVPAPAADTTTLDMAKPPGWLVVRPSPTADGTPLVRHETFLSRSLGTSVGYNIYLPPGYAADPSRRYPVVYWLHGMNGNEYSNISQAGLAHRAIAAGDLDPCIMVFVNGLGQSFYVDSPDGRYPAETLFVRELIPHIDGIYRTLASRSGRHIAGMSMGGFGCLRLAFKYPNLFASVVSYAGAFPTSDILKAPVVVERMAGGNSEVFNVEGPSAWLEHNVDRIRGRLAVRVVCGGRDRLLPSHREFSEQLSRLAVDHDYEELASFGHDIDGLFGRAGIEGLRSALAAGAAARQDAIGFEVKDPIRIVRMVRPSYPDEAKAKRVEGLVILSVAVGEDGSVQDARAVSGPAELAEPMVGIVRQWRFDPPTAGGKPARLATEVRFTFRLAD